MRYSNWIKYYKEIGLPQELIDAYASYIKNFSVKSIPVIYNFEHLSLLLGRNKKYLASAVNSTNSHYREFSIPKRSGGDRSISAPYPALLLCQKWINSHILSHLDVSIHAHGFVKGRSIITNANSHIGSSMLLKMDLKDFFPSITFSRVMKVFLDCGYTPKVSFYLSRLCTLDGTLPQGAPSSPTLSNIIAKYMDMRLSKFAKSANLVYTRYADDLVFSGPDLRANFVQNATKIISESGFIVNDSKTQLIKSDRRKIVTGIYLCGQSLKLPRKSRRELTKELHFIFKYGYYSHITNKRIRDPFYSLRLQGRLAFWRQIEPDNQFVKSASIKLNSIIESL
ncbi:MAG: retron St85 family RNA-directed DNA polymerase [Candidatus Thiodiazotropha endolucinida]